MIWPGWSAEEWKERADVFVQGRRASTDLFFSYFLFLSRPGIFRLHASYTNICLSDYALVHVDLDSLPCSWF